MSTCLLQTSQRAVADIVTTIIFTVQARCLHDPIEWLLSHAPAAWGNISYAQYILQFIVYSLWPREFLTSW